MIRANAELPAGGRQGKKRRVTPTPKIPRPASPREWMDAFAKAVRARDLDAGLGLVAQGIVGFGTSIHRANDADTLRRRQWSRVWLRTRGFSFAKDGMRVILSGDGKLACVLAEWTSQAARPKGKAARRRGRCTVILAKRAAGWKSLHTHFSLTPQPEFPPMAVRGSKPSAGARR